MDGSRKGAPWNPYYIPLWQESEVTGEPFVGAECVPPPVEYEIDRKDRESGVSTLFHRVRLHGGYWPLRWGKWHLHVLRGFLVEELVRRRP